MTFARHQEMASRIFAHVVGHTTIYLLLLSIGLSLVIVHAVPIYFRGDDAISLEWGHSRSNPLVAFRELCPNDNTYRPMCLMTSWFMYRFFGTNPAPYHFLILMLYFLSLIALYRLAEASCSRRVALLSLLAYLGVFYYLANVAFWYSDFTLLLDTLFINTSLFLLIAAVTGDKSPIWGIIFYLVACLTKEPAILIVPIAFAVFAWSEHHRMARERRNKTRALAAFLMCFGLAFTMFHPSFIHRLRSGVSTAHQGALPYMYARMEFYSNVLLSKSGLLIWFSVFYLMLKDRFAAKHPRLFYPLVAGCLIISLAARRFESAALPMLFLAFILVLMQKRRESFAVAMFAIPLSGLMLMELKVRTYLLEASMGMAIIMGAALDDIALHLSQNLASIQYRRVRKTIALTAVIAALGAAIFGFSAIAKSKFGALTMVSAVRQSFGDCMEYIIDRVNDADCTLIVIEYEDLGIDYYDSILPMDDSEKARLQKPMEGHKIEKVLRVADKSNIRVENIEYLLEHRGKNNTYLLVMNNLDLRYVEKLNLRTRVLFEVERKGEIAQVLAVDGIEDRSSP